MRHLAPAGTPVTWAQIFSAARHSYQASNGDNPLAGVAQQMHVRHVLGVGSGRAALWLILKSLHGLHPERDVVALPAYTCFTVPAAVARAGLRIHPVDIDPETLDFDFEALQAVAAEKLLCVVTSNLFGLVNDGARSREIAKQKGAYLVDDAAQAMGATRDGMAAGTLGDVGLYSLGRGKALAAMQGGLIVTDDESLAEAMRSEVARLPVPSGAANARLVCEMFAYSSLLQPRWYWVPNSLPFLKLGATEFDPAFATTALPPIAGALLNEVLSRLPELNAMRRKVAAEITVGLEGTRFTTPAVPAGTEPAFIRFPLLAESRELRDEAVRRLVPAGIGASAFYPAAICDIEGIGAHMAVADFHRRGAEELSQRILTLPTHSFVQPSDVERMVQILQSVSKNG